MWKIACCLDFQILIRNFALWSVPGTFTSARRCRSRGLRRRSHQSNTTAAAAVSKWQRRSRRAKRRLRPRERHSRETGAVPEKHGRADGERHFWRSARNRGNVPLRRRETRGARHNRFCYDLWHDSLAQSTNEMKIRAREYFLQERENAYLKSRNEINVSKTLESKYRTIRRTCECLECSRGSWIELKERRTGKRIGRTGERDKRFSHGDIALPARYERGERATILRTLRDNCARVAISTWNLHYHFIARAA